MIEVTSMPMTYSLPLLVFTDLDGTLIDHSSYRWDAALPALNKLKGMGAGVVLASSKTAAEIRVLQKDLELQQWPAIVENGSGLLLATDSIAKKNARYDQLRRVINDTPINLRDKFHGFADMTTADVAANTGLSLESSALAKNRLYSEPGLWSGSIAEQEEFLTLLTQHGVTGRYGGRFLTLSFGGTKADHMSALINKFKPRYSVALGDAPNDIEMLEAADYGVIVRNPHREELPRLATEAHGRITRTDLAGPQGWNDAIIKLIQHLEFS